MYISEDCEIAENESTVCISLEMSAWNFNIIVLEKYRESEKNGLTRFSPRRIVYSDAKPDDWTLLLKPDRNKGHLNKRPIVLSSLWWLLRVGLWNNIASGATGAQCPPSYLFSCWLVLNCILCIFKEHASRHCCETRCIIHRASFLTKTVPCGNELHKFLIWDTAGQERVRPTPYTHHKFLICVLLASS